MKKYRVSENHEFLKPGLEFSEFDLVPIKINELFRNDTAWAAHRDNPTWFEEIESERKIALLSDNIFHGDDTIRRKINQIIDRLNNQ